MRKSIAALAIMALAVTLTAGATVKAAPDYQHPDFGVPLAPEIQEYLFDRCEEKSISYTLAIALIETESGFNVKARSKTGDTGLMQANDINKPMLAKLGITDLYDPYQNIDAGLYILSQYEDLDISEALMAYNMGRTKAASLVANGVYESKYSKKKITGRERELAAEWDAAEGVKQSNGEIH